MVIQWHKKPLHAFVEDLSSTDKMLQKKTIATYSTRMQEQYNQYIVNLVYKTKDVYRH